MKVTRKLTLPGGQQYESSTWEIELTESDLSHASNETPLQDVLQELCLEAQARVLACAVADCCMSNEEMTKRLTGFLGKTPEWLTELQNLRVKEDPSS